MISSPSSEKNRKSRVRLTHDSNGFGREHGATRDAIGKVREMHPTQLFDHHLHFKSLDGQRVLFPGTMINQF
jgi:hypothetical protein